MAEITVTFNNQPYHLACRDGEEDRLAQLAAYVDETAQQVKGQVSRITDSRLLLMTAILIADELHEARTGAASGAASAENSASGNGGAEGAAACEQALEAAVRKVETLARSLESECG